MKRYVIDLREVDNMSDVHDEIKEALELPDYYGKNLDALNDCLKSMPKDSFIYIIVGEYVFDEFDNLIEVFDNTDVEYEVIISAEDEEDSGDI